MRSASTQFLIPAVLRVRMYVSAKEARTGRLTLSRRNIMLRDKCTCQCAPMHRLPLSRHAGNRDPAVGYTRSDGPLLAHTLRSMCKYMRGSETVTVG